MMTTIDWHRVDDLASEIGNDAVVEVVAMFLEETDAVIARLATAPPTTDDFHFLKGSALNLGLTAFAALCQQGEQNTRQGVDAGAMLAETLLCYDQARSALLTGIAARFGD
jgi:histidine phosphotransfer protein HptB